MRLKSGIKLLDERAGLALPAKKGDSVIYNLKIFLNRGDEVLLNQRQAEYLPAQMIRTVVILFVIIGFVSYAGKWSDPFELAPKIAIFLTLSGLATGASWVCYFCALQLGEAAKVALLPSSNLR